MWSDGGLIYNAARTGENRPASEWRGSVPIRYHGLEIAWQNLGAVVD